MTNTKIQSGLYIVATPIGNLGDITLRALDVLRASDFIYCEDTRVSSHLLKTYGINTSLKIYHEHNAPKMRPIIIEQLKSGKILSLISDAGTPLISDPGYKLVQQCQEENLFYTVLPGASASISGLVLSGFPTDQFHFAGFVNPKKFDHLAKIESTLIFFESCHRLVETLKTLKTIFTNRECCVVREISKLYEEVKKGCFEDLIEHYTNHPPKGECVVLLSPPIVGQFQIEDLDHMIAKCLQIKSLKDTSEIISHLFDVSKKIIYKRCLELSKNTNITE